MTDLGAPVTTLDQFWTLILTTGHLLPLLLPGPVKLATPPVEGRQAAVTFKLDITGTFLGTGQVTIVTTADNVNTTGHGGGWQGLLQG